MSQDQATLARRVAHDVLVRVARDGAYAERALHAALSRVPLAVRDRALAHELVYGTLRHAPHLDFCLASQAKKPLSKLPVPVWMALRLGAYQLLHTRVPPRSAVHESVALVGRYGQMRGLVNAILRKLATLHEGNGLPTPDQTDELEALAIEASQPIWLLRDVAAQRGVAATRAWALANNEVPPVCLRVNRRRTTVAALTGALSAAGVAVETIEHAPDMVRLRGAGAVTELPGFVDGLFSVQDPAAALVAQLAAAAPGDVVLDACAAPGGKATHLAEMMDDTGTVVALDLHPGRVRLIIDNAARLGLGAIDAAAADASDPVALVKHLHARQIRQVDVAVLDAPCSGMGTLRRNPELRTRAAASVAELCNIQDRLLDSIATIVRPGGVLVFAVCTPTVAEGPERIAAFLARRTDFHRDQPPAALSDFADASGALRTWTDVHGWDSFYAVRLRRAVGKAST